MNGRSLRILVVDDDRSLRRTLTSVVEEMGSETIQACNGREGLAKAREFRPDIIITDCVMPVMDGIEMVRAIREDSDLDRPYIILVTVLDDDDKMVEAFEAGVDDFMGKPLRAKVIAARLRAGRRIIELQRANERHIRELERYSQQLTLSNLRLRELAVTDELTGLPNRRYARERMEQEWTAAARLGLPLSCMAIHLGGLKNINDVHGQERGDVVLKTVAAILRKQADPLDIVCRTGGDEFAVLCPGTALNSALARAELLVDAVRSFGVRSENCRFGLSIGVAERRPGMADCQTLINLADRTLSRAKYLGWNLVCSGHDSHSHLPVPADQVC